MDRPPTSSTSRMRRAVSAAAVTLLASAAAALTTASPAAAAQRSDPGPSTLPSAVPAAFTPNIDNGRVHAIAQVGNNMIVGGSFMSVAGVARQRVVEFNQSTGALVSAFAPTINGDVNAVIPGPTANTVYIGGTFTTVNAAAEQFIALLNLNNGGLVTTFKSPAFNYGFVNDLVLRGSKLYVAGTFTSAAGHQHQGMVALNAMSGALDPSISIQFTGHHNDSGSGAQGWVGPTDIDITQDGKTMVVIGNFKNVNGQLRNQVALIDLSGSTAALSPWSTTGYAPLCSSWSFDWYVRGVSFSPNDSFFVINTTGGGNPGTLCDTTARFETTNTPNSPPTWIDQTGRDTLWGITVTNLAAYVGGHNRWENNPFGTDNAKAGAVPYPGMAALDVATGRPFAWNPGHIPLGVSPEAFLATTDGVWMGYDETYIGNRKYKRERVAFFPYAGGYTPASTTANQLPGTLFLGGNPGNSSTSLRAVAFDGSHATASAVNNQGIDFNNWRGAFKVGNTVYYGYTDNFLYSRTFNGTTFGPATKIDPYDNPVWSNIIPYSGSPSLRGVVPSWYGQLKSVTGMAYNQGRLYYALSGDSHLYSKWFLPDSGVIDETTRTQTSSVSFSQADGMFVSGGSLYYASTSDGDLRKVALNGGNPVGSATVVSGPGLDGVNWSNRAMFLGIGA
jgi:hypothetical protein